MDLQDKLRRLPLEHDFFIGIDSDGSVFDTMEIKQKECFCPNFIRYFNLQKASKYARETWEFVNLYSRFRGLNRFLALDETVKLLEERPEVMARNVRLPDMEPLQAWLRIESKLSNPALEEYARMVKDPRLDLYLQWSRAVNACIEEMVYGISPFPMVREILVKIREKADTIVVSGTPIEALEREWRENEIDGLVKVLAGQEYGTKTEHLALAARGKLPGNRILMVGDAPGDLLAARTNDVLFFPVNPGHEEESWERLYHESLDRFFSGNYEGKYEEELIREFNSFLPERPPWQ
jgi:phosphoglycolate phosphatase-like HAD superfamily hydrolase